MRLFFSIVLIVFGFFANAQKDTTYSPAQPVGGLNRVALVYYDIEFTSEQRKLLTNQEVELIFSVSDYGIAVLENVNGLTNRTLIDSLHAQTPFLPRFTPEMRGGVPKQSLFFMRFQFPSYQMNHTELNVPHLLFQRKIEKDQFKLLTESGRGFEFVFHGIFTNHFGNVDQYLHPGGGFHLGCEYIAANKLFYGLGFELFSNRATEKKITVRDSLRYSKFPFSATVGFYIGKWFSNFSLQFEASYGSISLTESDLDNDIDGAAFGGFSPGVFINYPIKFKSLRERVTISGGYAFINRFAINLRGGIRGFILDNTEVNSVMVELGAGIRFGSFFIKKYRLKDSFYID